MVNPIIVRTTGPNQNVKAKKVHSGNDADDYVPKATKGAVKKVPQQGSQCLKALATKN